MNDRVRPIFRCLVLALVASALAACHFHDHCYRGRHFVHVPVRHCR